MSVMSSAIGNSTQWDYRRESQNSRTSNNLSCSPDRQEMRKNTVLKTVIKKLAREMIKKSVPKQVFEDCADDINKAFSVVSEERIENHKKNLRRLNSRKIMNESQTSNDGFFSPQNINPTAMRKSFAEFSPTNRIHNSTETNF